MGHSNFHPTDESAQRMSLNLQLKTKRPDLNCRSERLSPCKKSSGSSDNKIHRSHGGTSRYLKFCLNLAVEESTKWRDLQAVTRCLRCPALSYLPPKSSSEETNSREYVLFHSSLNSAFPDPAEYDLIYQGERKKEQKKGWQFQ